MNQLPDFTAMTKEEVDDWFLRADTTALITMAEQPSEPMAHHTSAEEKAIRVRPHPNVAETTDGPIACSPPEQQLEGQP